MALLKINNFKGCLPKLHPRNLPDAYSVMSRNVRSTGSFTRLSYRLTPTVSVIQPIQMSTVVYTFPSAVASIFLWGSTWYGWDSVVDAALAPIAADRLYFTGDGAPKMTDGVTTYPLALPAPVSALTIAADSTPNPLQIETILYTYTYVTSFGEESQPAPVSALLDVDGSTMVTITGFVAPPAGRAITKFRIYRSQTSTSGTTDIYFVAELASTTTTYDHDINVTGIAEVCPSKLYNTPDPTMIGLTAMPNGMMAAFSGKQLYFSEPYQPHAWPENYALLLDHAIVGLCALGSSLVIMTEGTPYVAQGTTPSSMSLTKIDTNMPCLNARSIVDMGANCYYAAPGGLATITPGAVDLVTHRVFDREQWVQLYPQGIIASKFDGRYLFTYSSDPSPTLECGVADTDFTGIPIYSGGTNGTLPADFVDMKFGHYNSIFGTPRLGTIDAADEQSYFMDSDIVTPLDLFSEPATGNLYILDQNGLDVLLWDDDNAPNATATWTSKLYVLPYFTNFGAILIQTDDALIDGNEMTCSVIADGVVVATVSTVNTPARLPSGFKATRWQVEITTNIPVQMVALANTLDELQGAI